MADETAGELRFVRDACARWVTGATRDILEPACGPGRLTVALARAGFNVRAFDLEPSMVDYARRKSQRYSSQVIVERGDMRSFSLPKQYDAAVCLLDSFRHLLTEADALAHLQAVARAVRSGGVYLLGLHLLPPDADLNCTERWSG
jgi:SAM-dependent methyltransferase